MRAGQQVMQRCIVPAFTKEAIAKLNDFGIAQLALAKELLLAQPLGICKITTYVDPKLNLKSLDLTWQNGKNSTRTVIILTNEELKEML